MFSHLEEQKLFMYLKIHNHHKPDWIQYSFKPHMHEIFLQRYYMKWVPGDPLKEMIN